MKKISTSLVASFFFATNLFSTDTLETVTVTSATKSVQSIKDVTSNIDVITAQDIEARKFKTVTEALNTIPGIQVSPSGGIGQQTSVFLRGMDSNKTLVLIDGIRLNDPTGLSGANFEHLMINDIERIEVIKGAQSSIWGGDASAGVINIITKSAQKGTHGSAGIEYGRYDSKIANANISHKTDNFDAKLGVTRVDTNGFSAMTPKGEKSKKYEDDGYDNTTANIKLGYNFNANNRISGFYEIIDTQVDYDNTPNDNQSVAKTKTHLSNINYENKNDIATTNVYTNYTDITREYSYGNFDGSVKEYGVKSTVPYLGESSFVTIGADYKKFEHKNNLNKDYDSKAIFITNTNKFFNDKTIITEALRYDRYSDFDNKTTGKVGIKQYIVDDFNISANYGTGYNVPTIYQLFEPAQDWGSGPSPVGNPNLEPEKTKGYDVGLEYKGFSITYFDTKVNNMISYGNGYENINGNSKLKGTEFAYKNYITEDIFFNLNYTNLSAKNADKEDLARRAKDKVGFGVDYYGLKDFHFNINGEYIGTRYDRTNKQGASTGNYTIWNAVVDYDINKTFSTYVKLDNMFDKDYQIVDGYATSQRAAFVGLKAAF